MSSINAAGLTQKLDQLKRGLSKKGNLSEIEINHIKKIIEEIEQILQGGISPTELKSLVSLLKELGASIPSGLENKISSELKESIQDGIIDPKTCGKILESLMNLLGDKMLQNLPASMQNLNG